MAVSVSDSIESLSQQWSAVPYKHTGASDRFVLGDLRLDAEILLVGEAPGEDEDESGQAFVGAAGRKLNDTLAAVGLSRDKVSIVNVFPRRPPYNDMDKVRAQIVKDHGPFVDRAVRLHPNLKAVALMGKTALMWKTGQEKIEPFIGEEFRRDNVWWVPMYHPAAVLYEPSNYRWLRQHLGWLATLARGDIFDTSGMTFPFFNDDRLTSLFEKIRNTPIAYVDVESKAEAPASALSWWDPRVKPVLLSFGWFEGERNGQPIEPRAAVVEYNELTHWIIRDILSISEPYWGGSNALYYDFPLLRRLGLSPSTVKSPLDSYPIARMNDENRGCGAKDLAKQHFHAVNYVPYWGEAEEEAWQLRWADWPTMSDADRAERIAYSGKDAWLGIRSLRIEVDRMKQKPHLVRAYKTVILPQADAIEEMNTEGLPVNLKRAERRTKALTRLIAYMSRQAHTLIPPEYLPDAPVKKSRRKKSTPLLQDMGVPDAPTVKGEINFGSYQQVSALLDRIGFPRVKKTPKQERGSSDRFVLLKLQGVPGHPDWAYELLRRILDIRDYIKARGYVDGIIKAAKLSHDDRVHATFKIGPVTWRLACEEPNAQQWPTLVKELIEAPSGKTIIKFDHEALEVRGIADQAPEPTLIRLIRDGEDMHWYNTAGFMGFDYRTTLPDAKKGKNKKFRNAIKTQFFAGGYGAWKYKLADTLRDNFRDAGIGPETVREILAARGIKQSDDIYLSLAEEWIKWAEIKYPALKQAQRRIADETRRLGYVRSKLGFEWRFPEIDSDDEKTRSAAEREAYNRCPQNLSALTFVAWDELRKIRADMGLGQKIRLLFQEHDSFGFLADEDIAPLWYAVVAAVMPDIDWSRWGAEFAVPLSVEGSMSSKWT